jgi:hypothetical protein
MRDMVALFRLRPAALAVALAAVCVLAACASPKKSLSAPAQMATRVNTIVNELQAQLSRRDAREILSRTAAPLADDPAFARGLAELVERTTLLRARFVVERLWLQPAETVRVDLHWTLDAEPAGQDHTAGPATVTGSARFIMVGKETPRLTAVLGDNPFTSRFDHPLAP